MAEVSEKLLKQRAERKKLFDDWDIEKELPSAIGDYKLRRIDEQDKDNARVYYAFGWFNENNGWKVRVLYDEETADYMVKMDLHMITLTEIECITGDFEEFKRLVPLLTPEAIEKELIRREEVSILVKGKGFMVWDYEAALPESLGAYRRIIEPSRPLLGLNGSYIIAAYECREKDTGILFFYNTYRNEYYGELRAKGIPGIIHQYDAKTITALEGEIKKNLQKDLEALYENPEIPD